MNNDNDRHQSPCNNKDANNINAASNGTNGNNTTSANCMDLAGKVPCLSTALNTPLLHLEKQFLDNKQNIEHWFRHKWCEYKPPFYGSVDLRNAGYKIAPVDMNLFPGGFNNISYQSIPLAVNAVNNAMVRYLPKAKKVLLIPENHTRNLHYLRNVYDLHNIIAQAGFEVVIGSLSDVVGEIKISTHKTLQYHALKRVHDRLLTADGFDPCLIILNNDLSSGEPPLLTNIEQPVIPSITVGWHKRKKTNFFKYYDVVCKEFSSFTGIDEWLINPLFAKCDGLDFATSQGFEQLAHNVDHLLEQIRHKYQKYNISDKPFVIIKANNGTYGMGIMSVTSADEVVSLNRKTRNKMATIKDGFTVNDVIIQEGVRTVEHIQQQIAEPVIYMIDNTVIGGFYRIHPTRSPTDNLNAPGATFMPMSFIQSCHNKEKIGKPLCRPNRFYTYGTIARLALLASSYEIAATSVTYQNALTTNY